MKNVKTSQIKVIFFDIGGVLLNIGKGHQSRLKATEVFELSYDTMSVLPNFIFNVFEIGSISLDDYLDTEECAYFDDRLLRTQVPQ